MIDGQPPLDRLMHYLYADWRWIWNWLTKDELARAATVILVFITAWYAWLTSRMTRSMSLQTKAMVQPVLGLEISQNKDEDYPKGRWQAKNLGDRPVVLIDMRVECRRGLLTFHDEYMMYRNHVLPPNDSIAFEFDFTKKFLDDQGRGWFSHGSESFNIEIVAADISEQVILTYRMYLHWQSLSVRKGMPSRVRWRIWSDPTRYFYRRMKFRIERWLGIDEFSRLRKAEEKANVSPDISVELPAPMTTAKSRRRRKPTQTSVSPKRKPSVQNNDSPDGQ